MVENENKHGDIIKAWPVRYASGLATVSRSSGKITMQLTTKGFRFAGTNFPDWWIPHSSIISLELKTGYVSFWRLSLDDLKNEKLIQIIFTDQSQGRTILTIEMALSAMGTNNYRACKELIALMNTHGIFNQFQSAQPTSPTDIPAQIKQLAELRDAGVLTEDEFQSKKTELLGRL